MGGSVDLQAQNKDVFGRWRRAAALWQWLVLLLVFAGATAFTGGWVLQNTLLLRAERQPAPGRMVWISGEWVHLRCEGRKRDPVIFMEAGVMGWSTVWSWFFQDAPKGYRICAWDRPGLGWSASSRRPADAKHSAKLLHELMVKERIRRPVILVGHSLGGLYALVYRDLYPKDVRSLILIDPAHPQQLGRLPEASALRTFDQVDRLQSSLGLLDFGVGRGVLEMRSGSSLFKLPADTREDVIRISSSRSHLERSIVEYQAWSQSAQDALVPGFDIPLAVLSSSDREGGHRLVNEAWWELHRGMVGISSNGHWTVIPNTSHQSIIMDRKAAGLVIEQIVQTDARR